MLGLRVLFALNIIIFGSFHGECAVVNKDKSLIEAQSIGRIVNRISHKEIIQSSGYVNDITRASNVDQAYPCPHSSDIAKINSFQEPKINENPSVTNFASSYINSQSTHHSTDFQLQIQSSRPAQHIHYHYIVPNTPAKPIINYVSHSDANAYNVNSENKHYSSVVPPQPSHINEYNLHSTNRVEEPQVNPLYSTVDNSGYLYDSPDEHQGQASESTSVYESLRDPDSGQVSKEQPQEQQEAILKTNIPEVPQIPQMQVANNTKKTEVYFIKYYDDKDTTTTSSPDLPKLNDTLNEFSDGSGLIDIRAGVEEILDSQIEDTMPYNEHSAYNVPLN
ncbi:uncharacterized protein LOC128262586 [Drosophila gunungcola]|uniref:uncharacterized protein LOC128262586 n=1 Tax=Drosophila gunungcola TaxID=103775 RepID=UPI0022E2C4DF|nr:uncharacterized protein LOC128262586 [Drosophila gunungcola]